MLITSSFLKIPNVFYSQCCFFGAISASCEKPLPGEKFWPSGDSTRFPSICPRLEGGLDAVYGLEFVSSHEVSSSRVPIKPSHQLKNCLIAPALLQERLWRKNRRPHKKCVGTDLNRNFNIKWASKFVFERMRKKFYQIVQRTSRRAKLLFSSVLISVFVVVALTGNVTEV